MCSHLLCEGAHTDTGKVVDGESDVARVVHGKEPLQVGSQRFIRHASPQLGHSNLLGNELDKDLDKDTATRRRLILV